MPSSLIFVGLVVLWLLILVPTVARRQQEVARLSPAHAVGAVTGSAMCVTFAGVVVGPALFSALHDLAGSYARGYWLLAAFSLAGAGCVAAARRRSGGGRAL